MSKQRIHWITALTCGTVLVSTLIIGTVAAISESQVASRERITVEGVTHHVTVMRDHSVSFGRNNVRIKDGRFVTEVTVKIPRGSSMEYEYQRPSTPQEIAIYRAAF